MGQERLMSYATATPETHEWLGAKCGIQVRYEGAELEGGPHQEGDKTECLSCRLEGCMAVCVPVYVPRVPAPMQPVVRDGKVVRFKANAIVHYLWKKGLVDMNDLAVQDFPREDREQFAQLLGYSVDGASDLHYFSNATISRADALVQELLDNEVRE